MQCTNLSVVVVSKPGVLGGFSASLGVGQGGAYFHIPRQRFVLWCGLCPSLLLPMAMLW